MYLFFIDNVALPVTPSEVTTRIKNANETVTLTNGVEHNFIKLPGLSEIEFEFLIPRVKYPFAVYLDSDYRSPKYYTDLLERLKLGKKKFKFSIIRTNTFTDSTSFNTDMTVTLEDYSLSESAENGGDIVADVTLKQASTQSTKRIEVKADGIAEITVDGEDVTSAYAVNIPDTYQIREGDTLYNIAERFYGDGERWKEIYSKNYKIIEWSAVNAGYRDAFGGCMIIPGTVIEL